MSRTSSRRHQGFTLIEVMIASTISLLVIAGAMYAGIYLQRRGILEERTMETQNAGRAARDWIAPRVQRAGAGFGKARLNVGGNGGTVDQRYAVWPTTNATFTTDPGFALPTGAYAGLRSDALEVWEADAAHAVRLAGCGGNSANWSGSNLCTLRPAPPNSPLADGGIPANTLIVVTDPASREACVGTVGTTRDQSTTSPSISWAPGVPGSPFPAGSPCSQGSDAGAGLFMQSDDFIMPVTASAFRVNWAGGAPVLELDPDGAGGDAGYQPLARDIEQLKVRLGVYNPDLPNAPPIFFPDADAGRPRAVDECTNATCWALIPGDAGTMGASNTGPGSARDELMRRVRLVELLITARSPLPDTQAPGDGGTRDDEGNIEDGYKRRHFIIRVAPRNFGISGG